MKGREPEQLFAPNRRSAVWSAGVYSYPCAVADPISAAFVAKAVGGAAASRLSGAVLAKALEALQGPEIEAVLRAVDEELGTGVGTAGLTFLRDDPEIALLIGAYLSDRTTWDEEEMVRLIEPHVGPAAVGTSADHAHSIARAIERNAFKAQKDKTAAIVREVQAVRSDLSRLADQVIGADVLIDGGPLPRETLEPVEELESTSPQEAQALRLSLADEATRLGELRGLILNPPQWVVDGSGPLWATLGEIAQTFGLLELAEQASEEAATRPGADRARMLARRSDLARSRGAGESADTLLAEARSINPDHPSVRIVEAHLTNDAQERLDLLNGIDALNLRQAVAFEVTRTVALLSLGRVDDAFEAAGRARELNSESLAVRELEPLITLVTNQRRVREDDVDWTAVRDAADQYITLNGELLEVRRYAEAAAMRARAAEAYTLASDRGRATELLESITDDERQALNEEGARHLALASLEARRPDIATRFLEDAGDDDAARLLRAQVAIHQGPESAAAAVGELEALLTSEDPAVREQAALARTIAFFVVDDAPWSDVAERLVREVDAVVADTYVASRLAEEGDLASARAELVRHADDSRALQALVDLAARAEDWASAVQLQTSLVEMEATAARRLRLADVLERSDRPDEARQILDQLARDTDAPVDIRAEAMARLAEAAWGSSRYIELVDITSRWLDLKRNSPTAAWGLVLALTMLSRYDKALRVIEDHALEPRDDQDAVLAAHVFRRSLEAGEALRRIVELPTDSIGRSKALRR